MEMMGNQLFFERDIFKESLSNFNCGIREIDVLIHKKEGGLLSFISENKTESFTVFFQEEPVAVFVFSDGVLETDAGTYESKEIDFIAVKKEYRDKGIGKRIIQAIEDNCRNNSIAFLTVGAFINKHYSAEGFYKKCGFETTDKQQGNVIPMMKELVSDSPSCPVQ